MKFEPEIPATDEELNGTIKKLLEDNTSVDYISDLEANKFLEDTVIEAIGEYKYGEILTRQYERHHDVLKVNPAGIVAIARISPRVRAEVCYLLLVAGFVAKLKANAL